MRDDSSLLSKIGFDIGGMWKHPATLEEELRLIDFRGPPGEVSALVAAFCKHCLDAERALERPLVGSEHGLSFTPASLSVSLCRTLGFGRD